MGGEDIVRKFGLPREYCSCPECGKVYGYNRTKVCESCECCTPCCKKTGCPDPEPMDPQEFLEKHT